MAKVYVGAARGDEQGNAYGGQAGDQTGREVCIHLWERHKKGWRTLRARDENAREKLAEAMESACRNEKIGYDQWQRDTLLKEAKKTDYAPERVTTECETDCSALVRVCCAYAFGRDVVAEVTDARFYTGNLVQVLEKTGLFDEMEGEAYSEQNDFLMRGDIQCTKTQGHVAIVLTNGERAGETPEKKRKTLSRGMSGEEVYEMQKKLLTLGYDLGRWGADGEFGAATQAGVQAFQQKNGLEVDGICGEKTWAALEKAANAGKGQVRIQGGNCYVRLGPGIEYSAIAVAKKGETMAYTGETAENGWIQVCFNGQTAWISGKYAQVEAEE